MPSNFILFVHNSGVTTGIYYLPVQLFNIAINKFIVEYLPECKS